MRTIATFLIPFVLAMGPVEGASLDKQAKEADDALQLPTADLIPDPPADGEGGEIPVTVANDPAPLIFRVARRVVVQDGNTIDAFKQNDCITLQRRGSAVVMSVGDGLDVEFSIFNDAGFLVEKGEGGANTLRAAVRAARAAGTRMEQLVFTESTMMLVSTGFRSRDVTITYAERLNAKEITKR